MTLVFVLLLLLFIEYFILQNVGIDKGDIPDLTKAPSSLLDALEQHLSGMEGKKSSTASSTPASQNAR